MAKLSDAAFTSALFAEQTANPATPATGYGRLFVKADGVYFIDDAGAVTGPLAASSGATGVMGVRSAAGTADTLVLADAGKVVRYTDAAAVTSTVPTNASVAFAVGTVINIYAAGAGGVTIAPATGVTIRNNSAALAQYAEVSLRKDGTDEWVRVG